ncbi:CAP domain-containing protein [Modestobacter sp. VKM Ac-2978]|uniref:CAP domain-containing protein n=1 Tax=Modestobacter sp. VKM Ac-2978 TaxID=3004132 RepID=UPI0022AA1BF1|nr:CAP domain-containing protein [Modestobacter sp. VKM Ac-2978]MCZ2848437.1 CAP domain-containing protein [Modestobacter sp. VKM Ac-2978]
MPRRASPPSRLLRAVLLLTVVAAVALTLALNGGSLPGLGDTAGSSDVDRGTAPPAAAAGGAATTGRAPVPSPDTPAEVPATTTAAAPTESPAPSPAAAGQTSTPAPSVQPEPARGAPVPPPAAAAAVPPPPARAALPPPAPAAPPPAARAAPAPPAPAAPAAAPGPEGQVLALVNAERTSAGCAPVSADAGLAAVARAHSADMRDRGYFDHVTPEGLDPSARARAAGIGYARAENIASGQPDAAAVMAAWMSSPGHRQNILNCQLRTLGVGVATGSGGPWWTQLFGA